MRPLAWLTLLVFACSGRDVTNPGTPLGTFHATGALTSASCGGNPPDPWGFDVKLAHDARTLYWVQGGAPVQGQVDDSGRFSLTESSDTEITPADSKRGACVVTRTDTLTGTIGDGGLASGFTGTLSYGFAASNGADCTAEIGSTFATLPCDIRYDLTAVRTVAPDAGP